MQHSSKKQGAKQEAQKSYALAVEAVESGGMAPPHRQFLYRQRAVAVDGEGRVVLLVGCEEDLAEARAHPALVKVARALRDKHLATGIDYELAPAPTRTVAEATHTLPAKPPRHQVVLYIPEFLVCHTLPHRQVGGSEYSLRSGKTRLTLLAPSDAGLPYGTYPRLILIDLATRAVRSRQRLLVLGTTVNDFLRQMGIGNRGGRRGDSKRARDQLARLCQTTFIYKNWDRRQGASVPVVDRWAQPGPGRLVIVLGERFFQLARDHAVPLDRALVRKLRRSPLTLDLYAWLTYRVTTLKKETLVPWRALGGQFGTTYRHQRQFRWKVKMECLRFRGHLRGAVFRGDAAL